MHLQIRQNGEVAVTDTGVEIYSLFDANERGCLASVFSKIEYLHFSEDKRKLYRRALYTGGRRDWACFLSDDAIAISDYDRLIVLTPEGNKLHEEKGRLCYNFSPFIVCPDAGGRLYYTDDPRKGWRESDVRKAHKERTNRHGEVLLFTILHGKCYIALKDSRETLYLYRFALESPNCVEYIWEIAGDAYKYIARHNGALCITSAKSILGDSETHIPKNDGFLVWEPIRGTFYADIPRTTNIKKISAGRHPTISIPVIWSKNTQQR